MLFFVADAPATGVVGTISSGVLGVVAWKNGEERSE